MFDPTHLHICVAADENYARFVASLMVSVFKSNRDFSHITFHLLSNGIKPATLEKLTSLTAGRATLQVYDISNLQERLGIEVPSRIALTTYARLFMQHLIAPEVDRILYLDTDTLVVDSLHKLWTADLGGAPIGGVLDVFDDPTVKTSVGLSVNDPYINAGVLLIDLDMWRREDMAGQFLDFLRARNGDVRFNDQGIINGVGRGKLKILPPQYNMHSSLFSHRYDYITEIISPFYSREEHAGAQYAPAIIHFTEGFFNRPWKQNCIHPFRQTFIDVMNATPWAGMPLEPDTRSRLYRLRCRLFVEGKFGAYKALTRFMQVMRSALRRGADSSGA